MNLDLELILEPDLDLELALALNLELAMISGLEHRSWLLRNHGHPVLGMNRRRLSSTASLYTIRPSASYSRRMAYAHKGMVLATS